jgi:opacity protein-like surface antigen
MKNITIFLMALCFYTNNALAADEYEYTPYLGVGYDFSHTSRAKDTADYSAAQVYIGSDYSRYFGTELFFAQSDNNKKGSAVKTSYRAYGLDLAAYLPLTDGFSLLATAGIEERVLKRKLYSEKHRNEHGYGYRFGGGLRYNVTENWRIRMVARYINFDGISGVRHAAEYTTGIEYVF